MKSNKGKHTVLAIPDMHHPFSHPDTLAFLKWMKKKYMPDVVVCLGDEVDMCALSDYDSDPDGYSAGHELQQAILHLKDYYELFPNVKVCTSNHTARPFKRAYKSGIPRAFIRDYAEFLQAPPGWRWSDQHEVDGILYEHGEGQSGNQGAIKAAIANMNSTVIGHLHSDAGIQYLANDKHLIYGFNVGCLLDRHAYAAAYGKHMKKKPILGAGVITKGVPMFVPMILDGRGRWIHR